jgi:protein subunit release factor A
MQISGADLAGLDNEPGGHRIQRIPPTERRGRVHTSTVTVAILDPDRPQTTILDRDLRIEWYSGTGAGGQHRNKHQNSCRITHLPTGIMATAQCRSRENSLTEARSSIMQRVTAAAQNRVTTEQAEDRRQQVGSGMRGDKIRTYRFQDDVVQDHRTGRRAQVSAVMRGQFDKLW